MTRIIILVLAILILKNNIFLTNNIITDNRKINDKALITERDKVLLTIEIDKIGLKEDVLQINSKDNNIEKNITIMKESKLPYVPNGNLILGAHSGSGTIAYFNELIKLEKNDTVNIYHNKTKYTYKVDTIYDDDKNGKIVIRRDTNKNTLTLFTCKNNNKKYYLVVIAYLVEKTED